jgi:nucleoside 2-deoxyribosyltransferase
VNIYIAGKWSARERLAERAKEVEALGHKVVSSWLRPDVAIEQGEWASMSSHEQASYASRDLDEVDAADLLILDTFDESNTGGREVEYGYAIGANKIVTRVGPTRNGFHHLMEGYQDWPTLLDALGPTRLDG